MNEENRELESFQYDDAIVRQFVLATLGWGLVAFLLGTVIAAQLAISKLHWGIPWLSYGRLRPLHTNAAIFAFAGNAVFAGMYYSTQRLLKTRMFSDSLSRIHFWGWQLIIVSAALTLPFGITTGKEYAELEWPIDISIAVIWVLFAVNFFQTLRIRREPHMYVAIWFYIATLITIALLHVVNSLAIPVGFFKSYPVYAGVQDALVQWWYGHNAVAFFLTTPFLGLMYYFVPKAVGGPIYSYRLSVIHFWSLVFIYIWAGPHHLLYTSLPEWAQTLGMLFSVMLWAPSWGGMINGLLTLRGSWHRVRTEPLLKFFVVALTLYGMATFEGPLLSIKSVNSLAHYTDWIVGHVHAGALGWNGFLSFAMIYWLVPKLWNTEMYSRRLMDVHFWLGTIGILLYVVSMWTAGITQGLMWQAIDANGKLVYPDFIETVMRILPLYHVRLLGGLMYLTGFCVMLFNVAKTLARSPSPSVSMASAAALPDESGRYVAHPMTALPSVFTALTGLAIFAGTFIELMPTLTAHEYVPTELGKPYRALELEGRDIYVREGCYTCHSQQIRPMLSETLRYGPPSRLHESAFDHPFQWGSKRTGPDLAREGGKYPDLWHYHHMLSPRSVTAKSVMPAYTWLYRDRTRFDGLRRKIEVMKQLGVPYTDREIENAEADAREQAQSIAAEIVKQGAPANAQDFEIIALIAYLQRLGK